MKKVPGLLVIALTLLVLVPASVMAQPIVRFGAVVVLASQSPPPADIAAKPSDERLSRLIPKLQQVFRYDHYTVLTRFRAEAPLGTTTQWQAGDYQLELTSESVAGDTVKLKLRIGEISTSVEAREHTPAILGGPPYRNGVLIIVVGARPLR